MYRHVIATVATAAALIALLLLAPVGISQAGAFDPEASYLEIRIGNVPAIVIPVTGPGGAILLDDGFGGHIIEDDDGVWMTSGVRVTGPFGAISAVEVTVTNSPGTLASTIEFPTNWAGTGDLSGFGGTEPLTGYLVLEVLKGEQVMIPLSGVGFGTVVPFSTPPVVDTGAVSAGVFATGKANITGIQTPLISLPGRDKGVTGVAFTLQPTPSETVVPLGKMVSSVSVSGTNGLVSASQPGYVRLVAPVRVITTGLFDSALPVAVYKYFVFKAPEPGTALLFGTAIVTLLAVGRSKLRKR